MTYRYERKGQSRKLKVFRLKQMTTPNPKNWQLDQIPLTHATLSPNSELLKRLLTQQCEYCSKEKGYFEVHHVRKLADIQGKSKLERVMIARRRKTMVLCVECHDLLHAGELPDGRFKRKYA